MPSLEKNNPKESECKQRKQSCGADRQEHDHGPTPWRALNIRVAVENDRDAYHRE
jgi:hypothetical protein